MGGFIPERLAQGFGLSGEAAEQMGLAEKVLSEAMKGEYGIPEKISTMFNKVKLGGLDMSAISRKLESASSMRAYHSANMTFLDNYAEYTKAADYFDPQTMNAVRDIPGLEEKLNATVKSARAISGKIEEALGGNLTINVQSVIDDVARSTGLDIAQELGPDVMSALHSGLKDAMSTGKTDEFFLSLQQKMESHLDDLFMQNLEAHIDKVAQRVKFGGPKMWYEELGDAQDMWHSAEIQHRYRV